MTMHENDPAGPWLFVGTIPDADFPLGLYAFGLGEGRLALWPEDEPTRLRFPAVGRGTPAMLAAASLAYVCAGAAPARDYYALVAGDIGKGDGSRQAYQRLVELMPELRPRGISFHYLLPDVDWHNRVLMAVEALPSPPLLLADAGYMYAAKMSGYARSYDLFTPDIGELAFLADELAPHPFYTRNFLLADEAQAPSLIARAHAGHNDAKNMLVKGHTDRYVQGGKVLAEISEPDVPMMEPIGGTGDTLTGIVSALLASGMAMERACPAAFRINRRMGQLAQPTPAWSVLDLLAFLPQAMEGGF